MQVDSRVDEYLTQQSKHYPSLASTFTTLNKLYDQKLWHELTVELTSALQNPDFLKVINPIYTNFVSEFQSKMNKISLVRFVSVCASQKPAVEALAFLDSFRPQLKQDDEALVLLEAEYCNYLLQTSRFEDCQSNLLKCEQLMEKLPYSEILINASYYRVSANYFKAHFINKATKGYQQYYHNALLYLSSVNLNDLSADEKLERGYDLCMSALLADNLYNFGELLLHPILTSMAKTKFEWLKTLLFYYNTGDLQGFDAICKTGDFLQQPLLANNLAFLRQKLCLMTLMEIVFKRTKEERIKMKFDVVAAETRIPVEEVEHLVMKAFSLGLLKGKIDEVDSVVMVEWVQPRVLQMAQIEHIKDRIKGWNAKVGANVQGLENELAFKTVFAK